MPAAAVMPAPKAYTKIVVVETLDRYTKVPPPSRLGQIWTLNIFPDILSNL